MRKGHMFMVAGALSAVFGAAVAGEDDAAALLLKKTVASKAYVDNAFQAKTAANQSGKALVMNSNTAGDIGYLAIDSSIVMGVSPTTNNLVTNAAVQGVATDIYNYLDEALEAWTSEKQDALGRAGKIGPEHATLTLTEGDGTSGSDYLHPNIKGSALVTRTDRNNVPGERKIFEASDVSNYQSVSLNANQKAIQAISIPTMGAVAEYVNAHSPNIPAPTGDCLNTANHCALVTTYDGTSVSYSWTVMAK